MIGANILISIKALCILPAIVYFLTKNIAQKVFVSLFQKAVGSGAKPPSSSAEDEILFKISAGGVGECPGGTFFAENPHRGSRCSVYEFRIYAYCYLTTGFLTG